MPTYITLFNMTEQGVRTIKEAPKRVREAQQRFEQSGGKLVGFYLTMGGYDYVTIFEAPDDETAARLLLGLASAGNVRSTTLKAFTQEEFERIVGSIG